MAEGCFIGYCRTRLSIKQRETHYGDDITIAAVMLTLASDIVCFETIFQATRFRDGLLASGIVPVAPRGPSIRQVIATAVIICSPSCLKTLIYIRPPCQRKWSCCITGLQHVQNRPQTMRKCHPPAALTHCPGKRPNSVGISPSRCQGLQCCIVRVDARRLQTLGSGAERIRQLAAHIAQADRPLAPQQPRLPASRPTTLRKSRQLRMPPGFEQPQVEACFRV
jgi:hypothetical protein